MLKITVVRGSEPPTLKLEGKLSGPWVRELEHSWTEIQRHGLVGHIPIDLSDVTFISSEGKQLLELMFQQGADLQSRSLMTRFIVSEIKKGSSGNH